MPLSETTLLVVSTSTLVKFAIFSATSLAFTEAVIVESSRYWPAVSPVSEVHAATDNRSANIMEKNYRLQCHTILLVKLMKVSCRLVDEASWLVPAAPLTLGS
jgi:hypothetical protein